jgi:hypothetical protein
MSATTVSKPSIAPLTLTDAERQRCEVWTRVMGYHRPVASFNIGKKGEHHERCFFVEARAMQSMSPSHADAGIRAAA